MHDLGERYYKPIIVDCMLFHFSRVRLCDPMNYIACQAPLSMGFSRQDYWSGLPFIIVQYYIAKCVSWVPRLTLLDLRCSWKESHSYVRGLTAKRLRRPHSEPNRCRHQQTSRPHPPCSLPLRIQFY